MNRFDFRDSGGSRISALEIWLGNLSWRNDVFVSILLNSVLELTKDPNSMQFETLKADKNLANFGTGAQGLDNRVVRCIWEHDKWS